MVTDKSLIHSSLAVQIMRDARGHYGIEECAGPQQPATEWHEIQDAMKQFVRRWEALDA